MAPRLCLCSFFTFVFNLALFLSLSLASRSVTELIRESDTSGCGLLDKTHQYYATLEGVAETLLEGQIIPIGFDSYNIRNVTILSTSYLIDTGPLSNPSIRLFNTPIAFIEPVIHEPEPGAQQLRFRLVTSLSAYLRNATASVIEFVYRLGCADTSGSSVDGTLLLDIRDVNNVPPVFHVQRANYDENEDEERADAIPRYFIDLRGYEENPSNFNYRLASVSKIFVHDGDYMPANGQLQVVGCQLEDGLFDCAQLVQVDLKWQQQQGFSASVGSMYELKFMLVKEFAEFLYYTVPNASQLTANFTLTDGVHQASIRVQFDFVGRAVVYGVAGRRFMFSWHVVAICIGGICLTALIGFGWSRRLAVSAFLKPEKTNSGSESMTKQEQNVRHASESWSNSMRFDSPNGSTNSNDFKASIHFRPQLPPELRARKSAVFHESDNANQVIPFPHTAYPMD